MSRWLSWLLGVVVTAALVGTFFYMKDLHPLSSLGRRLSGDDLAGVAIRFKDSTLVGRSDGKKVWTFKARTVDLSKDRRTATFEGIDRGVLEQDGKEIASLSAGKVVLDTLTRNLEVPGEAVISLRDGPKLKVRDLHWDSNKSKLVCRRGVEGTLAGSTLRGESMVADLDAKELTITKVSGSIRLEDLTQH